MLFDNESLKKRAMGMLDDVMSVRRVAQIFNAKYNNHSTIQYVGSVKIEHLGTCELFHYIKLTVM